MKLKSMTKKNLTELISATTENLETINDLVNQKKYDLATRKFIGIAFSILSSALVKQSQTYKTEIFEELADCTNYDGPY